MKSEQCISVTELSKNASNIIKRSSDMGVQYIFVNNKPKAVILDYSLWENMEEEDLHISNQAYNHYLEARKDFDE